MLVAALAEPFKETRAGSTQGTFESDLHCDRPFGPSLARILVAALPEHPGPEVLQEIKKNKKTKKTQFFFKKSTPADKKKQKSYNKQANANHL